MWEAILSIAIATVIYWVARRNDKKSIWWGILSFVAFFVTQTIVGLSIALAMVIIAFYYKMPPVKFYRWIDSWLIFINIAEFFAVWPVVYLIYRYAVYHVPKSAFDTPPPPNFSQN